MVKILPVYNSTNTPNYSQDLSEVFYNESTQQLVSKRYDTEVEIRQTVDVADNFSPDETIKIREMLNDWEKGKYPERFI